jgi:hypothetical protein
VRVDSGVLDAPASDAPADAAVVTQDDGSVDGGADTCTLQRFELWTEAESRQDRVALAAGPTGFLAAWVGRNRFEELSWSSIPSEVGDPSETRQTILRAIVGGPAVTRVGDGYVLAFHSNAQDDYDIYTLAVDDSGVPRALDETQASLPPKVTRIEQRTGRDDMPAIAPLGLAALALWTERSDALLQVRAQRVDSNGSPIGSAFFVDQSSDALQVALTGSGGGAVATWVAGTNGRGFATTQLIGQDGITHASQQISAQGDADGTIEAAIGGVAGAVAFGAVTEAGSPQVRAVRVDAQGVATDGEQVLTEAGTVSRYPSVAAYGDGFVVAHRVQEDDGTGRLEVMYADSQLNVFGRVDAGPVEISGPVQIRVTGDGRVGVLTRETTDTETRVVFTRVFCTN